MTKHAPILVAEDEENDLLFLRLALKKVSSFHELIVARDGHQAVEYLRGQSPSNESQPSQLPGLFLLDLKMPRMSGFDVLVWLQTRPNLSTLPVVVLTSSPDETDRKKARQLGAVDYRVKPTEISELVRVLQELHARWLQSPAA